MRIERTKNASRSIFFGFIQRGYQVLIPFIIRTLMIYYMGVQYLGLDSLFVSIIQVLNLAELGVGSAMVYSMYKPIVENDEVTICAILKLYRLYYRIIGLVVAVIGFALLPFLQYLVKTDTVPEGISIYILYLLNLGTTVMSYWLFSYKRSILVAHQRNDIISKVTIISMTIQCIFQLVAICVFRDYYAYLIVALITQIINNILCATVVAKMYPAYNPVGKLDKDLEKSINKRIRDLFTAKFGSVVINSVDTIVISAFLGLTVLAIYQNYFYILNSVMAFMTIALDSCVAGIGNSIIVETKEKNFEDFKKLSFIVAWIAGFCTCCLLCLYQPFIAVWVGDELQLEFVAVVCFCVYYFVVAFNQLFNVYKSAAGIWHEDRFRPLITASINLGLNLIMVQFIGVYGVILSTVIATIFVGMPWLLHNLFTILFEKKEMKNYVKRLLGYSIVTIGVCSITYGVCSLLTVSGWALLFGRAVICCVVSNMLLYILYSKTNEFEKSVCFLEYATKGKLRLTKLLLRKR